MRRDPPWYCGNVSTDYIFSVPDWVYADNECDFDLDIGEVRSLWR
jgi:hypothetical protein